MSQIPCNIITDLLPLYIDNLCSEQTSEDIKQHLSTCETCRKYYDDMKAELPPILGPEEQSDAEKFAAYMKKTSTNLTFRKTLIFGIIAIFLTLIIGVSTNYLSIDQTAFKIPAKDITVTQLYELENGDIFITLKSDRLITNACVPEWVPLPAENTESEGSTELTPIASSFWFYTSPLALLTGNSATDTYHIILSPDGIPFHNPSVYEYGEEEIAVQSDIEQEPARYDSKLLTYDDNDADLTIWEKGMELKKAPPNVEKLAANPIGSVLFLP